ncbi:hypothetical protein [Escherichia coli]
MLSIYIIDKLIVLNNT